MEHLITFMFHKGQKSFGASFELTSEGRDVQFRYLPSLVDPEAKTVNPRLLTLARALA